MQPRMPGALLSGAPAAFYAACPMGLMRPWHCRQTITDGVGHRSLLAAATGRVSPKVKKKHKANRKEKKKKSKKEKKHRRKSPSSA